MIGIPPFRLLGTDEKEKADYSSLFFRLRKWKIRRSGANCLLGRKEDREWAAKKGICGEEEMFFAHNSVDVADSLMEDFKGPVY